MGIKQSELYDKVLVTEFCVCLARHWITCDQGVCLFVEGRGSRVTSRGSRVTSRGSRVNCRGSRVEGIWSRVEGN